MEKITYLFILIVVGSIQFACSPNQNSAKNAELIKQYVEAVESKDIETMALLLHEDYKGYGPSVNDSTDKNQAIESWKYLANEYYEEIKYEDFHNIAVTITEGPRKGDWVSNWSLLKLEFKDGSGPVELYFNAVYKIEDGKIIHSRTFYNEADVLRQLGYL